MTPIRFTNIAKKRITHDRRIEGENKLNELSDRGIKEWLASI